MDINIVRECLIFKFWSFLDSLLRVVVIIIVVNINNNNWWICYNMYIEVRMVNILI